MLGVVADGGWKEMRWERLEELAPSWRMQAIDTTSMTRAEVAAVVLESCRRALSGNAPTLHPRRSDGAARVQSS